MITRISARVLLNYLMLYEIKELSECQWAKAFLTKWSWGKKNGIVEKAMKAVAFSTKFHL